MGISLQWPLLLMEHPGLPGDPISVLQQGQVPKLEREAALRQLAEAAADGVPAVRNEYAAGLFAVGRRDEAEQIWQAVLSAQPDLAEVGLNLALCHLESGRFEECARVLRACQERTDPASWLGRRARRRLAELNRAISIWERQVRLMELRVAAFRERISVGLARPNDFKQLAWTLAKLVHVQGSSVTGRDVLDAARRAREAAPDDPESLELLVLALFNAGFGDEQGDALHQLEETAPHSVILNVRRELTTAAAQAEDRARRAYMRELGVRARTGDRAAEDLLRRESRLFPNNFQYRWDLAFAAFSRGDKAMARQLTDELAAEPFADHFVHFHIAQVYWFLGERELSREQFRRAYDTAATERDREDVRYAVRTVGAGDPEELGLQ